MIEELRRLRDLLQTRAYQAGLAALITELTPEATP